MGISSSLISNGLPEPQDQGTSPRRKPTIDEHSAKHSFTGIAKNIDILRPTSGFFRWAQYQMIDQGPSALDTSAQVSLRTRRLKPSAPARLQAA